MQDSSGNRAATGGNDNSPRVVAGGALVNAALRNSFCSAYFSLFFRKKFHEAVADLGAMIFRNADTGFLNGFHLSLQIVSRCRDGGNSQSGSLPGHYFIQLRHRHVEAVTKRFFQAADALTPIFQRVRVIQLQFQCKDGEVHPKMIRPSGDAGAVWGRVYGHVEPPQARRQIPGSMSWSRRIRSSWLNPPAFRGLGCPQLLARGLRFRPGGLPGRANLCWA